MIVNKKINSKQIVLNLLKRKFLKIVKALMIIRKVKLKKKNFKKVNYKSWNKMFSKMVAQIQQIVKINPVVNQVVKVFMKKKIIIVK